MYFSCWFLLFYLTIWCLFFVNICSASKNIQVVGLNSNDEFLYYLYVVYFIQLVLQKRTIYFICAKVKNFSSVWTLAIVLFHSFDIVFVSFLVRISHFIGRRIVRICVEKFLGTVCRFVSFAMLVDHWFLNSCIFRLCFLLRSGYLKEFHIDLKCLLYFVHVFIIFP